MAPFVRCLILSGLCVAFAGCGKSSSKTPPSSSELEGKLIPKVTISEEEGRRMATEVEEAVQKGDTDRLNDAIFDWNLCFDLTMAGVDVSEKGRNSARQGFLAGIRSGGLFQELNTAMKQGASYKHLRTREVDGTPRMLFRLILPNGGVNYHDFLLTKDESGAIKAYDTYIFTSGERLSETLRRFMLQIAAHENRGLAERMSGREQVLVRHLNDVQQIVRQLQAGNPSAALAGYNGLPQELKREKFMVLLAIRGAQESNNNLEYRQLMENFQKWFPDDPAVNFISIDHFAMQGQHGKALQAVDRLEKSVGGDPYLHILRAGIHVATKDYAKARQAADQAIAAEPQLKNAYLTQVNISLQAQKYEDTLKWLQAIKQQFDEDLPGVQFEPTYAGFRQSPQYKEWLNDTRTH